MSILRIVAASMASVQMRSCGQMGETWPVAIWHVGCTIGPEEGTVHRLLTLLVAIGVSSIAHAERTRGAGRSRSLGAKLPRVSQPSAELRITTKVGQRTVTSLGMARLDAVRPIAHDAGSLERLRSAVSAMTNEILGRGFKADTPPFRLYAEPSVSMTMLQGGSFDGSVTPRAKVQGVRGGKLRATVLGPVSGHVGLENALKWAESDTFNVQVKHGDGPVMDIATNVPSKGLVTGLDVEIPLQAGVVTRVLYFRNGSLGVSGYAPGRTFEIEWDGN